MRQRVFVGRRRETGVLEALLSDARDSSPRVVLVEGEAGSGKSALVSNFAASCTDTEVLWAFGDSDERSRTYGVLRQLLSRLHSKDGEPVGPDPLAAGSMLLDRLGRLQTERAVCVVVDDAHWADVQSLVALGFALRRLQADRVLAIVVSRAEQAEDIPAVLQRLVAGPFGARIVLHGLEPSDVAELAAGLGRSLTARAAARLCDHTGGSPLYVRTLIEELPDDQLEDAMRPLPVPRSIKAFVAGRLAGCSTQAREFAVAASVAGMRCEIALAASIAETDDPLAVVDELLAASLVNVESQRVVFAHPLLRGAVYEAAGPVQRSTLHDRAAGLSSDRPTALRHRLGARVSPDAALSSDIEAEGAARRAAGDWAGAAEWLVAASRSHPDTLQRERLLGEAAECLFAAGDTHAVVRLAGEAEGFVDRVAALYLAGARAVFELDARGARRRLTDAWNACDRSADASRAARLAAAVAAIESVWGTPEAAAEWCRRSLAAEPTAATGPTSPVLNMVVSTAMCGRLGEAESSLGQLALLRSDEDVEILAARGIVRLWSDRPADAAFDLAGVVERSLQLGPVAVGISAMCHLADAEFRLGRWDDSIRHAELAVSLSSDADFYPFASIAHAIATHVLAGRGQLAEADAHVSSAESWAAVFPNPLTRLHASAASATLSMARGEPPAAASALLPLRDLEGIDGLDATAARPWRGLAAEALVAAGDVEAAAKVLEPLEGLAARTGLPSLRLCAVRARATVEAARGDPTAAVAILREAAGTCPDELPVERARTLAALGAALRRAGRRKDAQEHLLAARAAFEGVGAEPELERVDRELRACGLRPRRGPSRDPVVLTPQERSVAHLVAAGKSNRQVAAELVVTVRTVEFHLRNIFVKTGVSSRTELAAKMAALGRPAMG